MRNNEIEYKQFYNLFNLTMIQIEQSHKIFQIVIIH